MSLAHAPKTTCPRCLELRPAMLHTCSPTDRWRELEAERDRYREALALLGKWAEESLGETPATQHPVLDAGSVLDLVNKTLLK